MKSTVSRRGQITVPSELLRQMHLTPGQAVIWEKISDTECRFIVPPAPKVKPDPHAALGFAAKHGLPVMRTDEWMKILRDCEG